MKLKLQAKAKLASLNKRIEELTEKGPLLPAQAVPGEQMCAKVGRIKRCCFCRSSGVALCRRSRPSVVSMTSKSQQGCLLQEADLSSFSVLQTSLGCTA